MLQSDKALSSIRQGEALDISQQAQGLLDASQSVAPRQYLSMWLPVFFLQSKETLVAPHNCGLSCPGVVPPEALASPQVSWAFRDLLSLPGYSRVHPPTDRRH